PALGGSPMDDPLSASRRRSEAEAIYARAVEIHVTSAHRLRASGNTAAAGRVDRLAASARDRVEHPAEVARLHAHVQRLRGAGSVGELLDEAVDGTIDLLPADRDHELRLIETFARHVADEIARRVDSGPD